MASTHAVASRHHLAHCPSVASLITASRSRMDAEAIAQAWNDQGPLFTQPVCEAQILSYSWGHSLFCFSRFVYSPY